MMKLGLSLSDKLLTAANFRFSRQMGATHLIAHLNDYTRVGQPPVPGTPPIPLWTDAQLRALKDAVNAEGLVLEGIENFDPAHWSDILLDGPRKAAQMEDLKGLIRALGRVGIPLMGYNFGIAGVWGRTYGPWARGGARTVGHIQGVSPAQTPLPNGTVWHMVCDHDAAPGDSGTVMSEQLWSRLEYFLTELVPVAEEAGVRLAAHPDDPPLDSLRGTARLVDRPERYRRLRDLVPSHADAPESCQGTTAKIRGAMGVYAASARHAGQDKLGLRPLPQRQGAGAELPRGFHGRGHRHAPRAAALPEARLRRRADPRPHPLDGVRRALARRDGLGARLHARGDRPRGGGVAHRDHRWPRALYDPALR